MNRQFSSVVLFGLPLVLGILWQTTSNNFYQTTNAAEKILRKPATDGETEKFELYPDGEGSHTLERDAL